ncbi:unnamed protein product, partial [Mesorhabditis belari]|uniref:C-type lectin domain-containing protein n=1 Tax=Mesorhabditis belari TaxID=2138241 RepID=A0AAF3EKI6_9BILA
MFRYLKQQIYPIRNANNLHKYTEISEISQFIEENDSKCEKEWKFLQDEDIGFCYRAWATPGISFESAKTMCRSYDANVVSSIRSHSEDVFVQNVALGAPTITKIWIGLEMNWGLRHWQNRDPHITYGTAIYGVDSLNQRVSAFMSDEQMRFVAKCIRCKQRKMNGLWYFVGLNESLNETYRPDGVVCKKRIRRPPIKYTIKSNESCDIGWAHNEHTGFCYYLQNYKPLLNESQLFTWNEAESDCKKRGSHLVSIHSLEEREFVKDLITSDLQSQLPEQSWFDGCTLGHGVWIGLHRVNGRIMNTDGSASRFFPSLHSQHDEDGYWWMCNDRANTYPEAIQTTYDWGQKSVAMPLFLLLFLIPSSMSDIVEVPQMYALDDENPSFVLFGSDVRNGSTILIDIGNSTDSLQGGAGHEIEIGIYDPKATKNFYELSAYENPLMFTVINKGYSRESCHEFEIENLDVIGNGYNNLVSY